MRAWYLVYNEVVVGKYTDRNKSVEVPLFAITEEVALLEAEKTLAKIVGKIDADFENLKATNPTGHFVKKQVQNPYLVLKVPLPL